MSELVMEVDNCVTSIVEGKLSKEAYQSFRRALGYRPEGWQHAIRGNVEKVKAEARRKRWSKQAADAAVARAREWDGYFSNVRYNARHCGYKKRRSFTHFDSGLLSNAKEFFDKYDIPYRLVDVRPTCPMRQYDWEMSSAFEPRDYQADARDKACRQKRGIIKCATGGGKTAIGASIIAELGIGPFIFYVTSIDLLVQAQEEIEKFVRHHGVPISVGAIGGGKKEFGDVTVMTVQTAVRALGVDPKGEYAYDDESEKDNTDISDIKKDIADLIAGAKGYIADEVQHWAAKTCQLIADYSESAYYRYGLSATPWRDAGDDIMIDACFGKCIVDISASFLIDREYLVQPEILFLNLKKMHCPYKNYASIYKHALKENPNRNNIIANIASRMYDEGRLPLVLVKHIDHGKALQKMIPGSEFLHGSLSKKVREEHIRAMRRRETGVTIATSIFDEGVDVKPLDTVLLAGSGKSATRALQRIGRILRPFPGKEKAIAIDFNDEAKYLKEHAERRRKIYETEPRFDIKEMDV